MHKFDNPPIADESAAGDSAPIASASGGGSRMLLCTGYLQRADPRLKSLLLWSDPMRSAAVLTFSLLLLWACAVHSFISVIAYLGLGVLVCTLFLRIYSYTLQQQSAGAAAATEGLDSVNGGGGPASGSLPELLRCLSEPVRLPRDQLLVWLDAATGAANWILCLLLCRDPLRTSKLLCWLIALTYIGAWCNAISLLAVCLVAAFSLPWLYTVHSDQVEAWLAGLLDR